MHKKRKRHLPLILAKFRVKFVATISLSDCDKIRVWELEIDAGKKEVSPLPKGFLKSRARGRFLCYML
jgi:hypothetical protein